MKNRHFNPKKPHHRPDGFQNNHQSFRGKRWHEVLRWRFEAWRAGQPRQPAAPIPEVPPDLRFIHANARAGLAMEPAFTWIGHSTVLAQFGGLNFITDPVFSQRCFPVQWAGPRRFQPPALTLTELPRIDVVLLSHNHYDHMDEASLLHLIGQDGGPPQIITPLGHEAWFRQRGASSTVELDWWDDHLLPATPDSHRMTLTLTPAQHWSARTATDALRSLWGSFAVRSPDCHFFFAGDTAYSRDFHDIRQHFALDQTPGQGGGWDMALLPIGAYEPRWFMKDQHCNPDESVRIFQDLHCKKALAIHWGTFQLTDESLDQPPKDLALALQKHGVATECFEVAPIGHTVKVPRRHHGREVQAGPAPDAVCSGTQG